MKQPISRRVIGLSKLSLMALLAVSIVSLASSFILSKAFSGFLATSKEVVLIQKVSADAVAARISAIKFRAEPTAEVADITREYLISVVETKDELTTLFTQEDALAQVDAFYRDVNLYWNEFEQALSERTQLQASVNQLGEAEQSVAESLASLMDSAHQSNAHGATYFGGVSLRDFLKGQALMQRFLSTSDAADFEKAKTLIENARSALAKLTFLLSTVDQRAFVDTALKQMTTYLESADAVFAAGQAEALHNQQLDQLGPALSSTIGALVARTTAQQELLGNSGTTTVRQTIAALCLSTLILFGFLYLLSRKLTAGIQQELAQSVSELKDLAEGNLDLDITRTEDATEAGEIARAMLVFRDGAIESKRLEAASRDAEARKQQEDRELARQREEQKRAQEEERQRERSAVIAQLTGSIGTVVAAAAKGDFSNRVDTTFDDQKLSEMSKSINEMMDSVEVSVKSAAEALSALANGDLTTRMAGTFEGLFSELSLSLDRTVETLSELVSDITSQSDRVGQNASELKQQSTDLAQRAERQAAALEETSATMEEIATTARTSAQSSENAQSEAERASAKVTEANAVVVSAISSMDDIRAASDRIGEIVSVIDGIAYQTNLLALNASVEAARAGDAGKGFAVVAAEVRALAQRSGEASNDIKELIDQSKTQIGKGVGLVEETGRTLEAIVEAVEAMSSTMQDLTKSARDQANGVAEVNASIAELDTITQENAMLSDQSRATGIQMTEQTAILASLVQRFRLSACDASHPDEKAAI